MSCTSLPTTFRRFLREATSLLQSTSRDLPAFLVPALALTQPSLSRNAGLRTRQASTLASQSQTQAQIPSHQSRIGRTPIAVPPEVSLRFYELPKGTVRSRHPDTPNVAVEVSGPLGQATIPLPPYLTAAHDQSANKVNISVNNAADKHQRAMWGTTRALLQNSVSGVSAGHSCVLRLVGVGYRATIESSASTIPTKSYPSQHFVNLKLGYAHPVELGIPEGVKASIPQPTRILLEGVNRQAVKQFAAEIRRWRVPEPYKGKGIFVDGETVRLKAKKIK